MGKIDSPGKLPSRYECEGENETEEIILKAFESYGQISFELRGIIHIGVFNYFSALSTINKAERGEENNVSSKKLTEIKTKLKRIQKLSLELSGDLDWIKGNPTIQEAVFQINPARRNENLTSLTEAIRLLDDPIPSLACQIERILPATNKWPEELKPVKELIKVLALAYEKATGKKATVNYSDAKGEYAGKFFNLVVVIFNNMKTLKVLEQTPSGSTVKRALRK